MADDIEENDTCDFLYKLVVIGDSGVGKSNLISRYTTNTFRDDPKMTIGVEFGHKVVKVDNKTIKAQIWDTAGQERFKALTRPYYRGAFGGLLVYSITDRASFEHLEKWLDELANNADPGILVMLVGNKADLESARVVSTEEGKKFAQEHGLSFLETSAKTGQNTDRAFDLTIQEIYKLHTNRPPPPPDAKPAGSTQKASATDKESLPSSDDKVIRIKEDNSQQAKPPVIKETKPSCPC
jgi:small GTP-binding protein